MRNTLLNTIGSFIGDIGRARSAALTFDRLNAMSDRALADRGLARSDLAAEAFRQGFGR